MPHYTLRAIKAESRARKGPRPFGDAISPGSGVGSGGNAPGACPVPKRLRAARPTYRPEPVCRQGPPACPPAGAVAVMPYQGLYA